MIVRMIATKWLTLGGKRQRAGYGDELDVTAEEGTRLVAAGVAVVSKYDPVTQTKKSVVRMPDEPDLPRETQ